MTMQSQSFHGTLGPSSSNARRALRGIAPVLNRPCCMPSMPWHVQVNRPMDSKPIWCFCSAHHHSPLVQKSTRFSQPSTNRRSTAALQLLLGMASSGEPMEKASTMTQTHRANAAKTSSRVFWKQGRFMQCAPPTFVQEANASAPHGNPSCWPIPVQKSTPFKIWHFAAVLPQSYPANFRGSVVHVDGACRS